MNAKRFSHPVEIFVGLGSHRVIENAGQAYEVLNEWSGSRGPWHAQALSKCRSALTNDRNVAAARIAFVAFARARGVLVPDALTAAMTEAAREWLKRRSFAR
ncbi:DUF982 domain-containing protein [Pseudaminobacter soli (ex Li et al. 2025)]|uniref:DUF982 domain-containing protein n=1 Tax=Pseudaminobacter soli (ex Li et al. 2025) TaxID=1295366 RepID=A0A2P7RSP9_9HYPH|nr:DUF982 domain-containing protein [Mesorhizobium soli]PSJ53222.1 DUF982 domain-containing protein [Mesorhizobium soli]